MAGPIYEIGAEFGQLTVLLILGTEHTNRGIDWVYRMQCACGNVERITQRNLKRGRIDCQTCSRLRNRRNAIKSGAPVVKLPTQTPAGVPNPALLPVPETIETGSENWLRSVYQWKR